MANPARQPTEQRPMPALERAPAIEQIAGQVPVSSAAALSAMLFVTLGMVALTFVIVALVAAR